MATKAQKIEHARQESEDLFIDEAFGRLDTRGLPIGMDELALVDLRDPFVPDGRFAPLDNQSKGFGSLALRRGIEELAERDPEVQRVLREHGVEDLQRPRSFNTPGWSGEMHFDNGAWHFHVESEEGEKEQFKIAVKDYDTAQIQAARYLGTNRVQINVLTKDQELYVTRLAQMGKLEDAINNYIAYSVPNYDGQNGGIITADPRYEKVCAECSWFVFKHSTPMFVDGPEVREFMTRFLGDRPVNVELLRFAFAAWNEFQKKEERGLIFNQIGNSESTVESGPTYENLDSLSDEEISKLRSETLRDRAKKIRTGKLQ